MNFACFFANVLFIPVLFSLSQEFHKDQRKKKLWWAAKPFVGLRKVSHCPTPPRPRASVPTPASHTLPKAFFPPSPRPKPSQIQAALFSFFSFFMLIRRDSNPSPLCLPLCLPISCLFNAYANCAIPARLEIQWFFCMLFICKSNSCPSLAVENNDIMNLWPRGPRGFRGPSTKTNQSLPNIMETIAFSALRKPLFNGFLYLSERSYS